LDLAIFPVEAHTHPMAENKTRETDADPRAFLATVQDDQKRADSQKLLKMMEKASGEPPKMWGDSLIGFGSYHYKYESGREGDFLLTGFSPRKANISIYIMPGFEPYEDELAKLGKHKLGRACLYIKRLSDIDEEVLEQMVQDSVRRMRDMYPTSK